MFLHDRMSERGASPRERPRPSNPKGNASGNT